MDSDRDYSYEELLQRVFGIMRDKNPEMVAGEKKKFVMRPPQVHLMLSPGRYRLIEVSSHLG